MKQIKLILTVLVFTVFTLTTYSCKSEGKKTEAKTEQAKQGKEYTSAYICPMHCDGSGSDKAGDCPVCGMAYEKNKDHKDDGHSHDGHDHSGHDH